MKASGRISLVPAYLLHHTPWRDSSRILEFFTREYGRVSLFARGVRRPKSAFSAVLLPFQRVLLSWTVRGEAGNFTGAELDGTLGGLPASRVMSGFYMNELLLKLLVKHDSHPEIFDDYALALERLREDASESRALRIFEKRLLDALGYGLDLLRDPDNGAALDPAGRYHYRAERGIVRAVAEAPGTYSGAVLRSLAAEQLQDEDSLREARRLLREALAHCLEGRGLKSREVLLAMKRCADPQVS